MDIRITGWKTEGFWCPDIETNLKNSDKCHLFQMENGVGKTTTITLIKMALFGESNLKLLRTDKSKPDNNLALRELVRPNSETAKFTLNCSFDTQKYTYMIEIDKNKIDDKIIKFWTTTPSDGKISGHRKPKYVKRFLTPEFGLNFIYDARKDNKLIEPGESAKRAIDTLCQFNVLTQSISSAKNYFNKRAKDGGGKGSDAHVTTLNKMIDKHEATLKILKKKRMTAAEKLQSDIQRNDEINIELADKRERTAEYVEKRKTITEAQKINDHNIDAKQRELATNISVPQRISKKTSQYLVNFKSCLEQCKLPHASGQEFFKELSEKDICVCGTPITEKEKKYILENSENFLGQEINNVLSSIKKLIADDIGNSEFPIKNNLEELINLSDKRQNLQEELDVLNENADGEDPHQKKLNNEQGKIELSIRARKFTITTLDAKVDYEIVNSTDKTPKNIKTCELMIEKLQDTLIEYTESVRLKKSYQTFEEIIKKTYEESKKIIFQSIKENVQKNIDDIFEQKDKREADKIAIENIDNYVELNRGGLSQGQKVAFTYAFLTEVQNFSKIKMPFVVDTPTGEMGFKFRPKVGSLIPKYTDQFLGFVQPAEKQGFVDRIRDAADYKCSNTTIFESNEKWFKNFQQTNNFDKTKLKFVTQNSKDDFAIIEGSVAFDEYAMPEAVKRSKNDNKE